MQLSPEQQLLVVLQEGGIELVHVVVEVQDCPCCAQTGKLMSNDLEPVAFPPAVSSA